MTTFVNGLRAESRDSAVSQLLHYLPLLRPANSEGARGYVHLLPGLLASFLEEDPGQQQQSHNNNNNNTTEIQQLLTYALIHPALSLENKRSLAELIRQLDDDGSQEMALSMLDANHQGELDMFLPPPNGRVSRHHQQQQQQQQQQCWDPWSTPITAAGLSTTTQQQQQPQQLPPSTANGQRIRRSNSLTPPSNSAAAAYPSDVWSSLPMKDCGRMKPRSLSLSSPGEVVNGNGLSHCPLSPQNSLASSGSGSGSDSIYSDDHPRPASFHIPGSGMKDVPSWLKGLRLHKYAHLFSLLTYEEMLALTEEQLELQGVTKGARHKIALSIQRLRDRPNLLAQLEKEVVETGSLHNALAELKTVLGTPIKPYRSPVAVGGERRPSEDQLYALAASLSPSPSLLTRDDTSGYSSLDGSMDNLAPRAPSSTAIEPPSLPPLTTPPPPPTSSSPPSSSSSPTSSSSPSSSSSLPSIKQSPSVHRNPSLTVSDMPRVIVSAAPDTDSAEEGGSDTSGDDGLGGIGESLSPTFRSAFGSELELLDSGHLSQDDLPGLITRLLGKICTQLLVSAIPSEDSVAQFVALLDRCIGHEAFTQRQRRRIASWKEQAHRIWNALPSSGRPTPSGPGGGSGNSHHNHNHHNHPQHHNGAAKNGNGTAEPSAANNSRSFARRWSNVAHYPGFYESSSMANGGAGAGAGASSSFGTGSHVQPNAYSLFPPGRQQQQRGGSCHPSPCPSPSHARPSYTGPTHNSYGQHTHLATSGLRSGLTPSLSLGNPHSLQVGSHLPLQHRNSFCVSALSSPSSSGTLYSSGGCYSSAIADHFGNSNTFAHAHRSVDAADPSFRLGMTRAQSAGPLASGLFSHERADAVEMDLNHRLESLCLSMTEHALEGANDT